MDWVTATQHFVNIVETGSFAEAARKRYTSASALSKQMAWLEERLNTKLLHRTTRNLSLTEAGKTFYEQAKNILEDIDCLEGRLQENSGELRGTIRFACTVIEQQSHLLELIPKFLAMHPKLRIELIIDTKQQDLAAEGIDLAIRTGYNLNSNLKQEPMGTIKEHVYGSPIYFEKHGKPQTAQDLLNHNCLLHTELENHGKWEFADNTYLAVSGSFIANSSASLIEAAKHGLGLIRIADCLIEDYVNAGVLIPVLEKYSKPCIDIFAVYPKTCYANPNVLAFIEFLKEYKYSSVFCRM